MFSTIVRLSFISKHLDTNLMVQYMHCMTNKLKINEILNVKSGRIKVHLVVALVPLVLHYYTQETVVTMP